MIRLPNSFILFSPLIFRFLNSLMVVSLTCNNGQWGFEVLDSIGKDLRTISTTNRVNTSIVS